MGATVSKLFGWGTKTKEEEAAPSSSKTDVADVETLSSRIAAGGDDDATSKVSRFPLLSPCYRPRALSLLLLNLI